MKLVPLLVLALAACKSEKAAKPAAGSAAVSEATVAKTAPKPAPAPAPALPTYTPPALPEGEVEPVQAAATGAAAAPRVVIAHDPVDRTLSQIDADHDGKVTPAELKASALKLDDPAALDTDGDGQISRQELAEGLRAQRARARASLRR
jgi:hypothetical protein